MFHFTSFAFFFVSDVSGILKRRKEAKVVELLSSTPGEVWWHSKICKLLARAVSYLQARKALSFSLSLSASLNSNKLFPSIFSSAFYTFALFQYHLYTIVIDAFSNEKNKNKKGLQTIENNRKCKEKEKMEKIRSSRYGWDLTLTLRYLTCAAICTVGPVASEVESWKLGFNSLLMNSNGLKVSKILEKILYCLLIAISSSF